MFVCKMSFTPMTEGEKGNARNIYPCELEKLDRNQTPNSVSSHHYSEI